jgi:hypothetical protein
MKKYINKLENEIKWLSRRERYHRKTLELLIDMVEGLLSDPTTAECPSFTEILYDMKTNDLREPWQVRLQRQRPPIRKGPVKLYKKKVQIKSKPKAKYTYTPEVKAKPKPKVKPKPEKSSVSKRTRKAMKNLKKEQRVFTGSIYGWTAKKDGSLVPNWKEQNNIDWMKDQRKAGESLAAIGRHLENFGVKGKQGGTWRSASVGRTIGNIFHETRKEHKMPQWFKNRKRPFRLK